MGLLGPPGRSVGGRGVDPGAPPSAALRDPHPMNGRLNPGVGLGGLAPSVNHHGYFTVHTLVPLYNNTISHCSYFLSQIDVI